MNCPTCNVHIDEHPVSRCLDAWIATDVMGLDTSKHLEEVWEEGYTEDGQDGWSDFVCPRCKATTRHGPNEPCAKYYSASIAAAWEVWDKLTDNGWIVSVCLGNGSDGRKYASVQMSVDLFLKADLMARSATQMDARALTVPHVLCRAAIKAHV